MRFIFVLSFFITTAVQATTIDFEEFVEISTPSSFETQGFEFSAPGGIFVGPGPGADSTNRGMGIGPGSSSITTMRQVNDEVFSIFSWDLEPMAAILSVTGFTEGGDQVSTTIISSSSSYFTYQFSSQWQKLTSIEFSSAYYQGLDNIVVSAVPIPAAAWLFGSALAGLGWLRGKQNL